jgi:ABC-type transport system involved in multi-copper enzyme maturation permease subunit
MIWLTWRQFRAQALTAVALLAAAAIYFLITGRLMHHTYIADLASCTPKDSCDKVIGRFVQTYSFMFQANQLLVFAVPALIGMFWGAPLIGREVETGTNQLVWNQTITRTHWLAVKLTVVGLASIATAGILSYLITWWARPLDGITGDSFAPTGNRFAALTFATRDVVPLGYAAFAFALGVTVGLLLRRTVPAMALTLAVFVGIQILVPTVLRPDLPPSTTTTFPINQATTSQSDGIYGQGTNFHFDLPVPQGSWITSDRPVKDSTGKVADPADYPDCFPSSGADQLTIGQTGVCLATYRLHETITYQPPSHYWPLQWYETGFFLVLAGVLAAFCFWQIRRRQN